MATNKEVGEMLEKSGELQVEWIFSHPFVKENQYYRSPAFSLSNSTWYIQICPSDETSEDSDRLISFYLMKHECNFSITKSVDYVFGIKRKDGRVEKIHDNINWKFKGDCYGDSPPALVRWSVLKQRIAELTKPDSLTIACTLRVHEILNATSILDTLSEDYGEMLTSGKSCDVTLKVKNKSFPAHKFILVARSPVFAALFRDDATRIKTQPDVVKIEDCDSDAFGDFLRYLYTGRAENLSRNAVHLYKIANEYDVGDLKSACVSSMMSNVSVENVFDVVILADKCDETGLDNKAQDFFNQNFGEIVCTEKWRLFMQKQHSLAIELLKKMALKIQVKKNIGETEVFNSID